MRAAAVPADVDWPSRRRFRAALRFGLGTAVAFTLAHALEWPLAMLAPVLTVQLLAALPGRPTLRAGGGIVLAVVGASAAGFAVSQLVIYPAVVILVIGVGLFAIFYAQARAAGGAALFVLAIAITLLPVVAVQASPGAVALVAFELVRASFTAVLVVWFAFTWIADPRAPAGTGAPRPPAAKPRGEQRGEQRAALRAALTGTAVILPLVTAYLMFDLPSGPAALVTALGIAGRAADPRLLGGLVLGNGVAGIAASLGFALIAGAPSLPMVFLVVLLLALLCGDHAAGGRPTAAIGSVALVSIVIFLDAGLSVLSEGTSAAFFARMFDIGFAIAWVIAALAVLQPRPRPHRP